MAYKDDKDLDFLKHLSSRELANLVDILIKDKDGDLKFNESLTSSDNYKKFSNDYAKYWQDIAEELQYFGGNTIISNIRGHGVLYREIAEDVAKRFKIKVNEGDSISIIEEKILLDLFKRTIKKLNESERKKLANEVNLNIKSFTTDALLLAAQAIFKTGGFKSYQLTLVIANSVLRSILGTGLTFAGNAMLTKTAAILTGPIGLVISLGWTVFDIAGPAFRVTIPAVVEIALLRKTYLSQLDKAFLDELNEVDEETKKAFGLYS